MSIQPIDLQTLFMRLGQVGKEQAAMREAAHVAQTAQGSEIARQSEEVARTVNETKELEDGPDAVKDEKQGTAGEPGGEHEESKGKKETGKKNVFQDPALGNKIDLSG
ncbi:MAG: hypothetical protein JW852_06930 [Spirochaetales bacterium]|nr:hypothetical protein [Spirochaetales bacterium]